MEIIKTKNLRISLVVKKVGVDDKGNYWTEEVLRKMAEYDPDYRFDEETGSLIFTGEPKWIHNDVVISNDEPASIGFSVKE